MKEVEINQDVLEHVLEAEYMEVYNSLQDGESKKIYQDQKMRIRLTRIGKRIFTVRTYFGDKPIEEIYKNVFKVQDMM